MSLNTNPADEKKQYFKLILGATFEKEQYHD